LNLDLFLVIIIVIGLVISLYTEILSTSNAFLLAAFGMVLIGVIRIEELLLGFSNKQILIIFLLMIMTTGIQRTLGNGFFYKVFHSKLSPNLFRLRMMLTVAVTSTLLNNTPVVAFMLPYVKKWSEEKGLAASKFLIPLSFSTILGGMVTVVGTSTNLVLNGLIGNAGLPMLKFTDFLFLGLLVSLFGIGYLYFFSERFLPEREDTKKKLQENIHDYLVETSIAKGADLIGKTIESAGLRHLKDLFLVEIYRKGKVIPVVDPHEILEERDQLFFAGNPVAILKLINQKNGLVLPESSHVNKNGFFDLTEAVIPSGSILVGESLKSSSFRDRFKASVISIYRNGEKVSGNLGEIKIAAGDLLLLLAKSSSLGVLDKKNLVFLGKKGSLEQELTPKDFLPGLLALGLLILGIFDVIDLFLAVSAGIGILLFLKVLNKDLISKSFDLDLLFVLVSSLAIGLAISNSGTASYFIDKLLLLTGDRAMWVNLTVLFLVTVLLTSLITNVAAVSIMFPFALAMSDQLGTTATPFFVVIAFAASADFMTPIGYQTNLMVMGPGNYKFKDFNEIGFPLTIIYAITVLVFVTQYYRL